MVKQAGLAAWIAGTSGRERGRRKGQPREHKTKTHRKLSSEPWLMATDAPRRFAREPGGGRVRVALLSATEMRPRLHFTVKIAIVFFNEFLTFATNCGSNGLKDCRE